MRIGIRKFELSTSYMYYMFRRFSTGHVCVRTTGREVDGVLLVTHATRGAPRGRLAVLIVGHAAILFEAGHTLDCDGGGDCGSDGGAGSGSGGDGAAARRPTPCAALVASRSLLARISARDMLGERGHACGQLMPERQLCTAVS